MKWEISNKDVKHVLEQVHAWYIVYGETFEESMEN